MEDPFTLQWQRGDAPDGGTRYDLPLPPFSVTRLVAALRTMAFGANVGCASAVGMGLFVWLMVTESSCVLALFLQIAVIGLVLGCIWLLRGITDLPTATTAIVLYRDRLEVIRRWGWFRWTHRCPLEHIRSLHIDKTGQQRFLYQREPQLGYRLVATGLGGLVPLAADYPLGWLEALGEELRQQLARTADVPLEKRSEPAAEPHRQPADSRSTLQTSATGLTLTVPPLGVLRDQSTLRIIVPILLVFGCVFTTVAVAQTNRFPLVLLIPAGLGVVAWFVGGTVLRTWFTTTTFTLNVTGLLLKRRHVRVFDERRWPLNEIAAVTLGSSSLPVQKGQPRLPQLDIRLSDGRTVGLLGGHPRVELEWIAAVLRAAHDRLPKPPELEWPALLARRPGERLGGRLIGRTVVVTCPALGFGRKMVSYLLVGLAFLTATGFGVAALVDMGKPDNMHLAAVIGLWFLAGVGAFLGLGILLEIFTDRGRTRVFHVETERLRIDEATVWGERQRRWERADLLAIDVGPIVSVGESVLPFAGLRLWLRDGSMVALGLWHTLDELLWLARVLRKQLNVSVPQASPSR